MAKLKEELVVSPAPPIFGGNVAGRLTLDAGSVLTDNEHGIDTLVRPFTARTDEIYGLLPKKGDRDKWIPSMRCTDRSVIEGRGLLAKANVTYRGLVDGAIPDVVVKGGWTEQTSRLSLITNPGLAVMYIRGGEGEDSGTDDVEQVAEVDVTYRAPRTTYLWVSSKKPTGPKYVGKLLTPVVDFSITEMRPARLNGRVPAGQLVIRTTSFEVETAGAYWVVTEVNQAMLIPLDAVQFIGGRPASGAFPTARLRTR